MASNPPLETSLELDVDSDNEYIFTHLRKPHDGASRVPGKSSLENTNECDARKEHDKEMHSSIKESLMEEMRAMQQAFLEKLGLGNNGPSNY